MRQKTILNRILNPKFLLLIAFAVVALGVFIWSQAQASVNDGNAIFQGITYSKIVRTEPIDQVAHIIKIDLTADGISFLVTPRGDLEDFDYEAQTVAQFLDAHDLQLAINGDYFKPWYDYSLLYYYPHTGDGVNTHGIAASQGDFITSGWGPSRNAQTLYISNDNHASFDEPQGEIYNAVSGDIRLIRNGQNVFANTSPESQKRNPRTSVGISQDGKTLIIIVVDGRQAGYSEGANFTELAQLQLEAGAYNAINMDGGGSATLVRDGADKPEVLNKPIQSMIPGRQRPVANQLGVYANSLP